MGKIWIFLLMMCCGVLPAQRAIDFEEIHRNVQDSTSVYFYEKLTYQFVYRPTSLDSLQARHLYYGQLKGKKKPNELEKSDFFKLVHAGNWKEAIPEGEKILQTDPVNLEVLGIMLGAYSKTDPENPQLALRGLQFRTLVEAVLAATTEHKSQKIYTVMKVVDSYIIAGVQNIDLGTYTRRSEHTPEGIIDHWRQGHNRISFLVVYSQD